MEITNGTLAVLANIRHRACVLLLSLALAVSTRTAALSQEFANQFPVYANGHFVCWGTEGKDAVYVPLRAALAASGLRFLYDEQTAYMLVSATTDVLPTSPAEGWQHAHDIADVDGAIEKMWGGFVGPDVKLTGDSTPQEKAAALEHEERSLAESEEILAVLGAVPGRKQFTAHDLDQMCSRLRTAHAGRIPIVADGHVVGIGRVAFTHDSRAYVRLSDLEFWRAIKRDPDYDAEGKRARLTPHGEQPSPYPRGILLDATTDDWWRIENAPAMRVGEAKMLASGGSSVLNAVIRVPDGFYLDNKENDRPITADFMVTYYDGNGEMVLRDKVSVREIGRHGGDYVLLGPPTPAKIVSVAIRYQTSWVPRD